MIKKNILTLWVLLLGTLSFAQPSNDECGTATPLADVTDWCSAGGEFTNAGATASGFSQASCFNTANNDVWFSFTAVASDINITVIGNVSNGGTLNNPAVALYSGDCDDVINTLRCDADNSGNNIIELYKGGLAVGQTYYIRINGLNNSTGTFQLCVNNYFPPVLPGSDCADASILCNTSSFAVQSVVGGGNNNNEAAGTCLEDEDNPGNSETNSTWFVWQANNFGNLSFTITPSNPSDDIDFVVFELENGINNCSAKIPLRCMASSCFGPTGLRDSSNDTEELLNCDPSDDNFLSSLQTATGVSYGLLVNNFSSTNSGFSISFDGSTTEFVGPKVVFTDTDADNKICVEESITFEDVSVPGAVGNITSWNWNFGAGASPPAATGKGPHTVQFNQPANISVVLRIETELGCIVSETADYEISGCCNSINQMTAIINPTNLDCPDDNGEIDVTVSGPQTYEYIWSTGETVEDLNGILPGNYIVTIYDQVGCDTTFNVDITGPAQYDLSADITSPTCGGDADGAIDLNISGGNSGGYNFTWTQDGTPFGSTEDLNNLPVGSYAVTISDSKGCTIDSLFLVQEFEIMLDPNAEVIEPSCFGADDGSIELIVSNGMAPYQFDFNDGNGFTNSNTIQNIPAGSYDITVRDANMCEGEITIDLNQPDTLTTNLMGMDIGCFGDTDGGITSQSAGGTPPYNYTWDPPQAGNPTDLSDLVAGTYSLTLTDANDCVATSSATIIEPQPINIGSIVVADNACFGGSAGELTVYVSGGTPPFQYSSDGINFQNSNTLGGLDSGAVTVTILDDSGCIVSVDAEITQPGELIVDAGQDVEISLGLSADLNASLTNSSADHTILWTPPTGLTCIECFDPVATPPVTTTYVATITTTADGCVVSDSVTVFVNEVRPVYIPNVFSPNFDGMNDVFMVFGSVAVEQVKEFQVFDRWGNLVYEAENVITDNPDYGWDGTFKGKPVNPGVYVYSIGIEFIDSRIIQYKGSVTVVR